MNVPATHYRHVPFHGQNLNSSGSPKESSKKIPREKFRTSSNEREDQSQSNRSVSSEGIEGIFSPREAQDINDFEQRIQQYDLAYVLEELKNSRYAYLGQINHLNNLKNLLQEKTDIQIQKIINWYEENEKILRMIRDELLGNLKKDLKINQEKFFFDEQKYNQEVEQAKKTIDLLTHDRQNHCEVYLSLLQTNNINKNLQEAKLKIEGMRKTLIETINIQPLKQKIESIIHFNEKALNALQIPEFMDKSKFGRIPGCQSITSTRDTEVSHFGSVHSAYLNVTENLRTARQNQNNT